MGARSRAEAQSLPFQALPQGVQRPGEQAMNGHRADLHLAGRAPEALARQHHLLDDGALAMFQLGQQRHDPLTGLANRRALDERIADLVQPASHAPPFKLALLDLDGFKPVSMTAMAMRWVMRCCWRSPNG